MHVVVPDYLFAERLSWSVIFLVSYVALFAMSSWAHRRDRESAQGEHRDRGSRAVIYIFSAIGATCAFGAPALVPQARIGLPPQDVFTAAIAAMWIGIILYIWAVLTLGAFFRTSVQLLDGQRLVTRGPYRLLRHPAYTGGILLFAGIGLAMGNWISFVGATLSVVVAYAWRIHVEEIALRERFGAEFDARRRRTWAVIPLLW